MSDPIIDFIEYMKKRGCVVDQKGIFPDGVMRRVYLEGDAKGKKNGVYQLSIVGEGRYIGWCRDHKMGVTHKFVSGKKNNMSQIERDAWQKNLQKQRDQREKQKQNEWENGALIAKEFYESCPMAGASHSYLERKKISPHGIRQCGICLIVPLYDINGKLWNFQRIYPDGNKIYQKHSKISGNFFPLYKDDKREKIIICEGFATGVSIFEATGFPVLCAMQANNLPNVAKSIRAKYTEEEIIIASDSDQWTKKPNGEPTNPGLEWGAKAAEAVNGCMVYPPFPHNGPKLSDFNDFRNLFGNQKLKEFF